MSDRPQRVLHVRKIILFEYELTEEDLANTDCVTFEELSTLESGEYAIYTAVEAYQSRREGETFTVMTSTMDIRDAEHR